MRTTVRLDEALLERARQEAIKRKTTLTSLIEQGLELVLRRPMSASMRQPMVLPECHAGGGTLASGAGYRDITSVGSFAPLGEYPRKPTPRESEMRRRDSVI